MPEIVDIEYYLGCFAKITKPLKKESTFIFVEEVQNEFPLYDVNGNLLKQNTNLVARTEEGKRLVISCKENCLTFPILSAGYYFDGLKAVLLSRLPVRRKEKGLTLKNTRLINPLEVLLKDLSFEGLFKPKKQEEINNRIRGKVDNNYVDYLKCFNNKIRQVPLDYGKKMIRDSRVLSIPIHHDWALAPSFTEGGDYTLFRRLIPIALLREDNRASLLNNLFVQELTDVFPQVRIQ